MSLARLEADLRAGRSLSYGQRRWLLRVGLRAMRRGLGAMAADQRRAARDDCLREAAALIATPGMSRWQAAQRLAKAIRRFETTAWKRSRDSATCPYPDGLNAALWYALKASPAPGSPRWLWSILETGDFKKSCLPSGSNGTTDRRRCMTRQAQKPHQRMTRDGQPLFFRDARVEAVRASPGDDGGEQRTVTVSFSSEQAVLRVPWLGEPYLEVLGHGDDEIDLYRMENGAGVFYGHDTRDPALRLGAVQRAWLEDGRGKAEVRISNRADVDGYWTDIRDGLLSLVSVGYAIHKTELEESGDTEPDQYRVTAWEPVEISFVGVPADPTVGAGRDGAVEAARGTSAVPSIEYIRSKLSETPDMPSPVAIDTVKQERERSHDIRSMFSRHPQFGTLLDECLDDPACTVDSARKRLLDEIGKGYEPLGGGNYRGDVHLSGGSPMFNEDAREAAIDSLLLRNNVALREPHPRAVDFHRTSLLDLAEQCLRSQGRATSMMTKEGIVSEAMSSRAMHTTSDFPSLLSGTVNKALLVGYDQEPATHRDWVRTTTASDFKENKRVARSEAPELLPIPEGGTYAYGTFGEREEVFTLLTHGRIFAMSRQMIINDDLYSFAALPAGFGQSAARLEADHVYGALTANAPMGDGVALFDAKHNNTAATPAALNVASLGAARAAMRRQRGINDDVAKGEGAVLNVVPKYLIVPAALETVAEEIVASTVNPFRQNDTPQLSFIRSLAVVADARLDDDSETRWYLASDWSQSDTFEICFLEGGMRDGGSDHGRGFSTDERWDFTRDSFSVKARLDFAVKPVDWRGLYRNDGA